MEIQGRVHNGVVVFDGPQALPEGAAVTVTYPVSVTVTTPGKKRVQVPLVRTGEPGTMNLTNERIAEIFDDEDVAASRC